MPAEPGSTMCDTVWCNNRATGQVVYRYRTVASGYESSWIKSDPACDECLPTHGVDDQNGRRTVFARQVLPL
jgi:hypothetical protein